MAPKNGYKPSHNGTQNGHANGPATDSYAQTPPVTMQQYVTPSPELAKFNVLKFPKTDKKQLRAELDLPRIA